MVLTVKAVVFEFFLCFSILSILLILLNLCRIYRPRELVHEGSYLIVPFQKEVSSDPIKDAIRALKNLGKEITLGKKLSIREMRQEGRKS